MPPQALHSIFCFPGWRLQPLPSHSSTNSRRRTAKPAASPAAYRFFSRASLLDNFFFSASRCCGNLRFCREPSCDEELHSIFVVSPSSKNNQLAGVWVYIFPGGFFRVLLHGTGVFLFSPRGAEHLLSENTICPCNCLLLCGS